MKNYIKTYHEHFNLIPGDFIACEICNAPAVDFHHIHARSQRKDLENDIKNIMALCRSCHIEFGDKKQYLEFLQAKHNEYLY